jgi:hypothetical protein
VRVHLAGEHSPELEHLELFRHALDLAYDVAEGTRVLLFAREVVQLAGFVEQFFDALQRRDDGFELGALAP